MHFLVPLIQTALLTLSLLDGTDGALADRLSPLEIESVKVAHERIDAPISTELLAPEGADAQAADPKNGTEYRSVCYAYIKENGIYVRRFAVHAADREALPLARNVARFYSLLWASADRRFGTLSRRLRARPVDVWLTRGGQAGGEQTGSSIYLYDVQTERSPIEWARELAHEYGHYLLPGASGYTEPESWSNGLLGERLFLSWLKHDLAGGRVKSDMIPFAKTDEIGDYCAKQPEPLIERVRRRGPDLTLLRKRTADAMDEFSAFLLYVDSSYGSRALLDLLDYLPTDSTTGATPEAFLAALTSYLATSPRVEMTVPAGVSCRIYLSSGSYRITGAAAALSLDRGAVSSAGKGWNVTIPETGWRSLTVRGAGEPRLVWERQ